MKPKDSHAHKHTANILALLKKLLASRLYVSTSTRFHAHTSGKICDRNQLPFHKHRLGYTFHNCRTAAFVRMFCRWCSIDLYVLDFPITLNLCTSQLSHPAFFQKSCWLISASHDRLFPDTKKLRFIISIDL